jgi:hypothetical protein
MASIGAIDLTSDRMGIMQLVMNDIYHKNYIQSCSFLFEGGELEFRKTDNGFDEIIITE